ncbi:MAG: ABC transporter permease [Chlamydiae bacterium]|nr:ABC transporter permease [Chlamydiota bacterium]
MNKRVYYLVKKEFLAILRDRRSRFVLIIPPLIQLFLFSYAATLDVKNVSIAILNQDTGKLSEEFVQRVRGSPVFSHVVAIESLQQGKQMLDRQQVLVFLQLDAQFSRNLLAGKPAKVQAILDGRKSNTSQVVMGYLEKIITQYNVDTSHPQRLVMLSRNWFNPNLLYTWFTVPGLVATLAMMTSLVVTAMTVARERELGTLDQLLVSPLSPLEIVMGKTIPGVFIGIMQASLMILAAVTLFSIPLTGSLLLLYGSLFFFILSTVGVGLFLSSLARTQQQALLYTFVFLAPSVILSGFATPVENMPSLLQKITDINPLKHFLLISRGVFLKDLSAAGVWAHTYPLMLFAGVNLLGASIFFKKRIT